MRIWILFASYLHVAVKFSNTFYLHHLLHIRFKIFAQIRIQIFDLMEKPIFCMEYSFQSEYLLLSHMYWQKFALKYLFLSEYSQNFRRISRSSKYLLKNICIQANIHLQLFAQKRISNTYCFKLYLGKPFTSLMPQLINCSFWKYSLRKEYSICFYSFCM